MLDPQRGSSPTSGRNRRNDVCPGCSRIGNSFDPFAERREFKSIDGRRSKAMFQMSPMPYFAEGGFASLAGFKRWEQRECFDYVLSSGEETEAVGACTAEVMLAPVGVAFAVLAAVGLLTAVAADTPEGDAVALTDAVGVLNPEVARRATAPSPPIPVARVFTN